MTGVLMKAIGRRISLWAVVLCLALQGATAEARAIQAPWEPLPADAKLLTDPAILKTLFADHTVHGVYLPEGTKWREYTAADGRTIWEEHGCLHPGTWHVNGSAICYVYPSWDNGRPQCFMVYQSAHLVHFVWLDSETGNQVLVSNALDVAPGNTDHLPLDSAAGCGEPAA
jgi:hypothetical protein